MDRRLLVDLADQTAAEVVDRAAVAKTNTQRLVTRERERERITASSGGGGAADSSGGGGCSSGGGGCGDSTIGALTFTSRVSNTIEITNNNANNNNNKVPLR